MEKKIHGIGVFLDSNLNFTITIFIQDLANDLNICKINMKKLQNLLMMMIIVYNLPARTINSLGACHALRHQRRSLRFGGR